MTFLSALVKNKSWIITNLVLYLGILYSVLNCPQIHWIDLFNVMLSGIKIDALKMFQFEMKCA